MDFLFKKVDIASLVFFRIVFGILGFADVLGGYIAKHLWDQSFEAERFQFKYYGFEWVKTLPDPWLSIVFLLTMLAAIGIALGKWYRWSATIFAMGFTYMFFLEKSYYLNHGYLTILISWWIIFMPLARHYAMDVSPTSATRSRQVSYWPLFLLKAMMGVVYFYGGLAKINIDWLNGQPMQIWLKQKSGMFLLGGLWSQKWVAYFMSYSGMLLDLLVVFFLLSKRTRIYALCFVLFFHLNNFILFQIGIFPFLSVTLTLLFFEPDFPVKVWRWLEAKAKVFRRIGEWWLRMFDQDSNENQSGNYNQNKPIVRRTLKFGIASFLIVMLLLPFRHHLFEGNVAWTEEGHRYSWRMMLRQKSAYGTFTVRNLTTNTIEKVNIREHLTKRQKRKMLTHPDMILQFSHYLRDYYQGVYNNEVGVFVDVKAKLNGRKYQQYIDPKVDLAKEEFNIWKHRKWIIPLKE